MGILLPITPECGSKKEQDADASINSSNANSSVETERKQSYIVKRWQRVTDAMHRAIGRFVLTLSLLAAKNPKRTIGLITFISFALVGTGFFTNFNIKVDYEEVYAPFGSLPMQDKEWIDNESGFPETPRPLSAILHYNGQSVLGYNEVDLLFEALDTIRGTPGYDEICKASTYLNTDGQPECKIFGATRFWDHSASIFHEEIDSDEAAIEALSAKTYPGGTPVYTEFLFGYAEREGNVKDEGGSHNGERLTFAKSYLLRINFPNAEGIEEFEMEVLDRLGVLQKRWSSNPGNKLHLSYFTLMSYDIEFKRAIDKDLILVPFVVLIMSVFTCLVFYKSDRAQSRSLLGLGSVAAVGLSLMSGYGFMFLIGIPFTSMTQLLPFIVFGVGLDDTFIIMGAYFRTDPSKDTVERIRETMLEVGQSISLTTITTMSAFILGCISTIPAIRWVCIYAFPTIFINFVYQITIFVAFLVLDERRAQADRRDCCFCFEVKGKEEWLEPSAKFLVEEDMSQSERSQERRKGPVKQERTKNFNERFMSWYATQLLKPWVKVLVFVIFIAYFAICAYCTTNLTQRFRTQDFVPEDSYVADFLESLDTYNEQVLGIHVYFRGVNQSDPDVQWEMRRYMHDLMKMPAVNGTEPPFCWVMDFEERKNDPIFELVKNLTFSEKVSLALSNPNIKEAYGDDIVQDENGTIVASRCWLNPKYLDIDVVNDQTGLLADQRAISLEQPVNSGGVNNLKFFTYDKLYFIWEFYTVAVEELIFTTVSGIVAVSLVGFILIEHRSATAFVLPMILLLYVDLLGTLQFAGLHINVVTYVCMVISIGLLVDFLMHIILRYFESPGASQEEKVRETLETMGASILVGGLSTFLGVIPLAFSTSAILRTVFTAFFAMVTLGLAHGLILLPVVLSVLGPTVCIHPQNAEDVNLLSHPTVADLEVAKNRTQEMKYSVVESQTADVQSISSPGSPSVSSSLSVSSGQHSCAPPNIPSDEEDEDDTEIVRIPTVAVLEVVTDHIMGSLMVGNQSTNSQFIPSLDGGQSSNLHPISSSLLESQATNLQLISSEHSCVPFDIPSDEEDEDECEAVCIPAATDLAVAKIFKNETMGGSVVRRETSDTESIPSTEGVPISNSQSTSSALPESQTSDSQSISSGQHSCVPIIQSDKEAGVDCEKAVRSAVSGLEATENYAHETMEGPTIASETSNSKSFPSINGAPTSNAQTTTIISSLPEGQTLDLQPISGVEPYSCVPASFPSDEENHDYSSEAAACVSSATELKEATQKCTHETTGTECPVVGSQTSGDPNKSISSMDEGPTSNCQSISSSLLQHKPSDSQSISAEQHSCVHTIQIGKEDEDNRKTVGASTDLEGIQDVTGKTVGGLVAESQSSDSQSISSPARGQSSDLHPASSPPLESQTSDAQPISSSEQHSCLPPLVQSDEGDEDDCKIVPLVRIESWRDPDYTEP